MSISPDELEQHVTTIIYDVMDTLRRHGITQVPVGAIMRLVGVPDHVAKKHDGECIDLETDLSERIMGSDIKAPDGKFYH